MRKWLLALTIILIIIFGILAGRYVYKITNIKDDSNLESAKEEKINKENIEQQESLKETSVKEEKVSPNAKLIKNIYYDECGHTITNTTTIENKYINLTKEEFAEEYRQWEVKEFNPESVTLYKKELGICNEHYIVKEHNGYVAVFSLDKNERETLDNVTEISTSFLPLTDSEKLKGGIRVYGKENLNSLLEDFE